jgi:hypothetical protein
MAGNVSTGNPTPTTSIESTEEYEHLLEDFSHFAPPAENEILQGRVL